MDRLVKQLITPFITEQVKAKKVIAVYPGRFQPFGPHHKKVFQSLQKKFGEVYITTSDIKSPPRHPMNFKEKVRHMVKMGIPKNRIIKERVPYVANNLLKKFDSDKTAVVYVFGAKDAGRLKGGKKKSGGLTYYQDYNKNKNKMVGYETHGYIYTAPHVNVSGISSGTEIRKLLGSPKFGEKNREIIFKKTFGYFDKGVYNMLTNKFRKLFEVYSKFIVENKDYIKKLIKEASTGANFPTDDGPPTFYKGFNDYETESGKWIKEMGKTYGWEVYDYLISRTAQNPEDDYTLEYNIVPSVAFGRENTGDYGKRFGVKEPIKRYIEVADRISKQLGYEVIKYMGIKPDLSGYTGVEVEAPVLPGRYDLGNTKRAELTGKQLGSGMTLLNTLEESLDLSNEVNMIFEDKKFKAKSKKTGRIITFKSKDARDKAVKDADVELLKKAADNKSKKTKKVKGSDLFKKKQKPYKPVSDKPKFKFKPPSIDMSKLIKKMNKNLLMKKAAKNRPDRKPNMKNGVDVMRNPMDDDHFIGDFLYKTDKGVDLEKRNKNLKNQWSEEKKKMSKKEQKQLRKDVLSWKQLGGFEAIEEAIRTGETTPEEIKKRNERISDLSHKTITKVDTPIERGISVPNEVADEILSEFKVGEMVEIPDENGHGSSGFSTSEETARGFAKVDDGDSEKTSIIFRILPNSKGEVRGAFIDGEPDDNDPPGFWTEEEITRSSKSKAEVVSIETKKLTNGKIVKIVTLQEPEDLTETIVRESSKKYSELSRRYLEGPINPKPQKKKLQKEQFKAKSKETGRVIVYKSKENMDKAIKGGRAEPLDKKTTDKPEKVKGQDMFAKDLEKQKKVKKPDNWETLDNNKNYYKDIRDYTDKEYDEETGEYFDNEETMKIVPNAFKDKNDMIEKMKNAKPTYLASNEMEFMSNTDAGDILNSDNPIKLAKQRAGKYGKDISWQFDAMKNNEKVPSPIALKDKNGDYHLLAGNTRLMSYTAAGKKLPIKVIDYEGKFQYNESIHECIAFSKKFGDDIVIGKNRDRNYTPELKVVREISGNGNEVCYVQDQDTDWSEGMNSNGIGLVNSALFVKRDEKDFDKAKKKKAPSKDGIRIRHALSKDTFAEVVESLVKFDTGVKGHTLVSNGKKLVVIENTSRTKPSIKIHDIDKSSIVRTNHGIKHPEQGYTRGPDRISSELRLKNAKELIDNEKEYKKVFPLFYNDTQNKGPKFDLVRAQNKLWTSSQILMNLNKKQLILYLIPGAVKFIGIENKLPKNYEPKINLDVRQYEHGPSDKYDTFVTTDKTPKKSAIKDKSINENLLLEGGAYGHMSHPFDDKKLTFADLKKIIKLGLSGELNREDNVTEKTDGQNLMITYRDGKVLAARNKGQIKNRGQNALDAKGIAQKFSGRGDIKDAFVFAMKDLTKAINSLSDKQKDKIFKNGEIFMNLEIIYPASSNVIDYDRQILQFHNSIQYDKNGNAVGEVKGSGRMLQGMIKQVNQDIGKHFKIIKPRVLALPKKIDFGKKVDIYYKKVDKLKNQYGLSDNDTLGKYHQSFWEEYIFNAGQQFGYNVPKTILKKLTKRWAFFDKAYKIPQMKKDLKKQPKFLEWVLNTDKQDHKNMVKKNMLPFEKIFFAVGADILENLSNFIAANPTKAVEKIRKEVLKASKAVRKAKDVKKMITLKQQLEKLNSIGGLKKIVPVEGIVFKYKGNTYKFTGAFAPVNQILGLVSF